MNAGTTRVAGPAPSRTISGDVQFPAIDFATADGTATLANNDYQANSGTLTFALSTDPISLNPRGGGAGNDALYVNRQIVDSLVERLKSSFVASGRSIAVAMPLARSPPYV